MAKHSDLGRTGKKVSLTPTQVSLSAPVEAVMDTNNWNKSLIRIKMLRANVSVERFRSFRALLERMHVSAATKVQPGELNIGLF